MSPHQSSQSQTGELGSVQSQLPEAHVPHSGRQFRLELHGPHILQTAQSQSIQQDEWRAESCRMAPANQSTLESFIQRFIEKQYSSYYQNINP